MKHSIFMRILSMCLALMLCMTASVSAFAQEDYLLDEGFSVNPVSGNHEEKNNEQEKDAKDSGPAPEPCNPWEHLPDETGVCTLCGMNLISTLTNMVEQMDLEEYNAVWNAVGWAEQQGNEPDEETQKYFDALFQAVLDAQDIYSCMSQIEDEQVEAAVSKLFAVMQSVQYHYDHPVDPSEYGKSAEKTEPDEQLEEILNKLYDGNSYLPDKPTGYYISETTGLPVLTGEVKTSISVLTENNVGGMDISALNNGSNTASIPAGEEFDVLIQVEYPENGSSFAVEFPEGIQPLEEYRLTGQMNEMSSLTAVYRAKADHGGTVKLTYRSADGKEIIQTLDVEIGKYRNSASAGASVNASWQTGSGFIGMSGYVGSVYVIGTSGGGALYCLDNGLNGRANDCPAYSASGTVYVVLSDASGWTEGAGFGTAAQVTNQELIWGGSITSSFSAQAEMENMVSYRLTEKDVFIIEHYPESWVAKMLMNSISTNATATAVTGTMYTPAASGWQRVLAGARLTSGGGGGDAPAEYYADWFAEPQTRSGSFDFQYNINSDKYQLDTLEKVDGAVIDVEPLEKSGTIDGGNWSINPATKQTITTSGHTADDSFQNNGGDGSVGWSLHYDVTKTSGSKSGTEGPYPSQEEADAAAEDAKSAAIRELQAEAQGMVDRAIAAAKSQLNTQKFRYDEVTVPYGFDPYPGSLGSNQILDVTQGTNLDYKMINDEWSLKVRIKKVDSETHQQIAGDSIFEVYEWDTVSQQYIPAGGYNQYRVERQADGNYKVMNHSVYADTAVKQQTMYYTQRNEGKFILVETKAPSGYYGDWSDLNDPGTADTPLGKRAYYVEITKEKDGSTIWLDNADYNADISVRYEGGTKLLTSGGVTTTVTIADSYKDGTKVYDTDNSRTANNEDSYTSYPIQALFLNDRTLGEISLSKVDLDAVRYVDDHGDASLEGAVYDLYVAEDISHPDGVSGVVDYSKILDADGNPIWTTTVLDNSGNWITDYLPQLCENHLVASAKIVDGKLTFSNLYLGNYFIAERSTGAILPVEDGAFILSGSYPIINARTKAATGSLAALRKNSAGQYTDYVYRNQFSNISRGKGLDSNYTYDGYYISYAEGYLVDEHNYYVTPSYENEGWYVEKTAYEDNRQAAGEELDSTRYSKNYHIHRDNALCESQDQMQKGNIEISKVVSSTGQSNGLPLESAGFSVYLISELSKADSFTTNKAGEYDLNSILRAYINPTYDNDTLKYDFSGETQALAKTYEVNREGINAYNKTLTTDGDYANGKGQGWMATEKKNQYLLSEVFSNDTGNIRIEGLPYGQYLVVETTTPKDLYQAEPFIFMVDASKENNPQSGMATPKNHLLTASNSYQKYTILDEEIEVYLRISKMDTETGKAVLIPNTAFQIYWMNEDGTYRTNPDGNPKLVVMTNTKNINLPKELDTFYTDDNGMMVLPEKLPLGHYRMVEITGPNGFYNEWKDTEKFWLDFEVTTNRIYEATGDDNEDGQDILVVDERYFNEETLGQLTIRKVGDVLVGYEDGQFIYKEEGLANAVYEIHANGDVYTQDRQRDAAGDRTLWYADGDLVATVTTGMAGQVDEVHFAPGRTNATYDFLTVSHGGTQGEVTITLPLGSYTITEKQAPYGFLSTKQSYTVTFEWDDQCNDVVLAKTILDHGQAGDEEYSFTIVDVSKAIAEQVEERKLVFENARVLPVPETPEEPVTEIGVGIYKKDRESKEFVAGAIFDLYTADDIYDVHGNKLNSAGDLLATSESTDETGFAWFKVDVPIRGEQYAKGMNEPEAGAWSAAYNSGNYQIVEKTAPKGYLLDSTPLNVSFTYEGQDVPWQVVDAINTNLKTTVVISKQDITNGAELPGATLRITDADENTVMEWTSTEESKVIRGLELDQEYTLTEIQPASGYALAESISFKLVQPVEEDGSPAQRNDVYIKDEQGEWQKLDDQTVVMQDDIIKVSISKKDIVSGEELPGATIRILDGEGKTVAEWVSTEEPHYLEKLPAGEYTLVEITAPDGYAVAEEMPFTVLPTGEIQSYVMKDAPCFAIDKTKVGGELLPGATLTIYEGETIIDQWVTDTNSHVVSVTTESEPLNKAVVISTEEKEKVYTLVEIVAPNGYKLAASIQFKVELSEDGKIVVYTRTGKENEWSPVEKNKLTMVDEAKPAPAPTPDPAPKPEPKPEPAPAPTPVPVIQRLVPQTGDTAPILLWAMMCVCGIAGVAFAFYRKRKVTEDEGEPEE